MPVMLVLDIAGLALSLTISTALVMIVIGAGLRRRLNRDFVLFAFMQTGWAASSLLLRLALWFRLGNPTGMLALATVCFAFMGLFLLMFSFRYMGIRGRWTAWTIIAVLSAILVHAVPLLQGRLVADPQLDPAGVVFYGISQWGIAASLVPVLCILFSLVLFWVRRRHVSEPFIVVSIVFLLTGFLVGGLLQVHVPIMSITNTASVAILGWGVVRRQLFNPLRELAADLRERAHRQELISQISRRTATLLELDELLVQAVTLIQEAFDYFTVGILLIDGDELVLRASTLASVHAYSKLFRLKVGAEGICGWVAAAGKPLLVGDVSREPRYVELVKDARTRSELVVPIRRGDRVIGVLDMQSAQRDAFTEKDLVTQQTIADQLSSAIENARLYEETRRRAERLALVNRISTAAGSVLDLGDLLETVYREVTPIFEADAFFIALYDSRANALDYRIQVDEGVREPQERHPLGVGLASRVVVERKPLLLNHVTREEAQGSRAWGSGRTPASWIGVPMLLAERIIGVLSVHTYRAHPYDEEDLQLAATIADRVAVALENARLYEEVRLELDERERTQKGLKESEEKFRNLAEQSPNMIFIFGKGRVMYANRQCELSTGYAREEFYAPGFDFRTLMAPGYQLMIEENFRRHTVGEEVEPYEYSLLARGGRRIDAILTTKLMSYDGVPAILGIVTDITARKRTEQLLQSMNAAALAMEQALTPAEIFPVAVRVLSTLDLDSAVFLTDGDTPRRLLPHCWGSGTSGEVHVSRSTDPARLVLGVDEVAAVAEAMDGRRAVFTALGPEALGRLSAGDAQPLWPGRPAGPRVAILAPLSVGEDIFGLLIVSREDLGSDDVQVFTAFAHQAAAAWRKTKLMRDLEGSLQQLRQTQDQLLHAQKMEAIGRLAGGIAHDFNNILTVISGYTSLLMDTMEGNAPALSDLGQIRNTIKRASALTSRLLAFSRKQILQPAVLDMNKVVANSVTLLRPLIGEDIELVVRLAPVSLCVRADHYQMEQILMNLAVNARDAMPGGGKLLLETAGLDVEADSRASFQGSEAEFHAILPAGLAEGPYVLLRVQDNGVGMSEETRERIFEPFFTTKDEGKGSGLGLSTVYGIITQSGGRVRVETTLGRGTTFTVCIPRVPAADEHAAADEPPPSPRSGSGTVLLVEDESDVRELARRVLEKGGYDVIPVASAREALLIAEGSAVIDIVVTDVVMPGGMSGVEMGERLSRTRPTLPVLYMSGYTDDARIHGKTASGRLPFLGKPFQPAELLARVQTMVKNS
jgi:PAS domain S-box-containing protein